MNTIRLVTVIALFLSMVAAGIEARAQDEDADSDHDFTEFAPGAGTAGGPDAYGGAIINALVESGEVEQGLIDRLRIWNMSKPLSVCFWGGKQSARQNIAAIAKTWELEGSTIRFDFGDLRDPRLCGQGFAQIRVGYSGHGYWSTVGTDSITQKGQDEVSLNLQGFGNGLVSSRTMRRKVLHEFGHALGFTHEHARCRDEIDPEKAYAFFARTQGWDRAKVDANVLRVIDYDGFIASEFDPKSIMMYPLKSNILKNGSNSPCAAREAVALSQRDVATAMAAYSVERDFESEFEDAEVLLAEATANLSEAERAIIEQRLEILAADSAGQAEIIGTPRPEFVDVDVFACKDDQATMAYVAFLAEAVASQPKIGRLRLRDVVYPDPIDLSDGVAIIADTDHPEMADAERLAANIGAYLGDVVKILPNTGGVSRWYLSIVGCRG